jgi:nucleoside 2-deoxyribosyltransferase
MSKKKIYLACPYSDPDEFVRFERYYAATKKAAELIRQGHIVYSPITHSHPINQTCNLPNDFEFWRESCLSFIDWCDEVYVLDIDGWKESKGVQEEISYALSKGKTVVI